VNPLIKAAAIVNTTQWNLGSRKIIEVPFQRTLRMLPGALGARSAGVTGSR